MPQWLGGGRPEAVTLEIVADESIVNLETALPRASCTHAVGVWICKRAFVVAVGGKNWVVADGSGSTATAVVLPRSSITLMQAS